MRLSLIILHLLSALGAAAVPTELQPRWTGTTRRTTRVTIVNRSPTAITSVSLKHKYSSVYKDSHEWARIETGSSARDWMTVSYNTGPLTTGQDWWLLTFYDDGGGTLYATAPNNFRAVFDALESVAGVLALAASGAAASLAVAGASGPAAAVAAGGLVAVGKFSAPLAAIGLAKFTADRILSSEPTDGFKQHTLREEDEWRPVYVIVHPDYTVTIRSNSDESDTVTAAVEVKKPAALRRGRGRERG
ncbi:hypothetical protein CP533_3668 [Ophiocordyceps camponoti-saundersi (nom. inval.)]|nr:hypothetical protein CP533_3668 [Ophiocordyceps camponoti-saundersi (nom. inval.)]